MKWAFIVNSCSGGGEGRRLKAILTQHFPQLPVCDLGESDFLAWYRHGQREAFSGLIIAGGDGTIHWLIHQLVEAGEDQLPLVVPWPMGTGNDCAQYLRWPRRSPSRRSVADLLEGLALMVVKPIDRWQLTGPHGKRPLLNYLSVGFDARIALAFDRGRRRAPWLYRGPLFNKALYGFHALGQGGIRLAGRMSLDQAALPSAAVGVIWSNIPSFAGGQCLNSQTLGDDGLLDCFIYGGLLGLGLALSPVRQLRLQAQAQRFQFALWQPLAMQIDGEPLVAAAGDYTIERAGVLRMALPAQPAAHSARGVERC